MKDKLYLILLLSIYLEVSIHVTKTSSWFSHYTYRVIFSLNTFFWNTRKYITDDEETFDYYRKTESGKTLRQCHTVSDPLNFTCLYTTEC